MRGLVLIAALCACSFEHGVVVGDANPSWPDAPPDIVSATWEIDAASKKAVPAAAFEWVELANASGLTLQPPNHLWLMQESAGTLVDSIGSADLAPQGGPTYRNAISGWSRSGVGTIDVGADQGFVTNSIGNLNGSSYVLLLYVAIASTPSSDRSLFGVGAASDHRYVAITPQARFKATGAGVSPTTGAVTTSTTVHPVVMKLQPSQLSYVVYTDQEKLDVAWTGTGGTGGLVVVGNATVGAASARYLYGAMWTGASAELSDADVKMLMRALGWSVSGY